MTFNSIPFIILFPIAVILFYVLPARFRYIWLLLLSYAFYYAAGGAFLMLLAALTVITYISALAIDSFDGPGIRKTILILTLLVSLCTLFAFKYLNLALELSGSALRVDIILPLGISFYTFQAVSYIMDVYRRKIPGEKNILKPECPPGPYAYPFYIQNGMSVKKELAKRKNPIHPTKPDSHPLNKSTSLHSMAPVLGPTGTFDSQEVPIQL